MSKKEYSISLNKRRIQGEIYSRLKKLKHGKIVGLSGSSPRIYVTFLKSHGFKHIVLYENNRSVICEHYNQLSLTKAHFRYGDIYDCPIKKGYIYDLDFCYTIKNKHIVKYIHKFKKNFILTLCLRAGKIDKLIPEYFSIRGETIKGIQKIDEDRIVFTDEGKYVFKWYFDTSPMVSIYKDIT